MRRQFLIRLSAVICAAFIVTAGLVYFQFSTPLEERAEQMMKTRLLDMMDLLMHVEKTVTFLSKANDASATDRALGAAQIIQLDPSILRNQEELQGMCNRLGAEQLAVTDEHGIVEAAVPGSLVGHNLQEEENAIPIITLGERGEEVARTGDLEATHSMQFANVRRQDRPGRVRIGFRTRLEQEANAESSLRNAPVKMSLGKNGSIVVFRRGVLLTRDRTAFSETDLLALKPDKVVQRTADGKSYYLYAVDGGWCRLVGVLPASEVYGAGLRTVQVMVASNLVLFLMMFGVVSWLLQRIVLRGISRVNESLLEITEGDLERKVEVMTCPEFVRLSNGINFMVDSLRSVGEERQAHVQRDLELARTIQSTALPNKFPPFPHVKQFDLFAACIQANEVGGDFYDFSMPDDKHLHFLVADVDASGIAAALFMMRAMSVIRTLSRSGGSPESIVSEANRELCQGNRTGIHMSLIYGNLDITTGHLEYVNAGCMHGLYCRKGGEYVALPSCADYVLGDHPDMPFHTKEEKLQPGDRIFLYTEGVLNATNTRNVPFSETRLKEALRGDAPTVTDVLQLVKSSLRQYLEGERLGKDVTMLALEFLGEPGNEREMELTAGQVQEAEASVSEQMEEMFAAPSDIADMQESLRRTFGELPAGVRVRMLFHCTEKRAEMKLVFPAPRLNPLERLGALPVNEARYDFNDHHENTVTLCKNLI